jgi:RNA polymerase sigma factor (sigma-70 family)
MGGAAHEEFHQLFVSHVVGLLNFLTYQIGDRASAEQLLAEVFARGSGSFGHPSGHSCEKLWLYSVAVSCIEETGRKPDGGTSRLMHGSDAPTIGQDASIEESRYGILQKLNSLPPDRRLLVALRFGGELSVREIAELVEERPSTVAGQLTHSLQSIDGADG